MGGLWFGHLGVVCDCAREANSQRGIAEHQQQLARNRMRAEEEEEDEKEQICDCEWLMGGGFGEGVGKEAGVCEGLMAQVVAITVISISHEGTGRRWRH